MATQADGQNQHASLVKRISNIMTRHPTLGALTLAFVLSLLSDYVKSSLKPIIVSQPLPRRFFAANSMVLDYPYGHLADVGNLLTDREALFVMYYAPWCAKSRWVRSEFEQAADYMRTDLQFVGVNAWYPNGTCRQQNNFASYPVLFFYHLNRDGYRYQGILKAEHMIDFAYKMLYPLTYIYSRDELVTFLAHRDNAVLGFFDFNSSPQPPGFLQYYYSSLRLYEMDPKNPVEFAVITSPVVALYHGMQEPPLVHLARSLNTTLKFPSSLNWTSRSISSWVLYNRQGLSISWILPSGDKSSTLSAQLKSPALIMFTPLHPLAPGNDYASVLREVALDYYNCKNLTHIPKVISTLTYTRWLNSLRRMDVANECQDELQVSPLCREIDRLMPTKRCCQSVAVGPPHSGYNSCDVCLNYLQSNPLSWVPCSLRSVLDLPQWPSFRESFPTHQGACAELMPYYNPGEFLTVCCENHSYYQTAISKHFSPHGEGRQSNDPFVINAVRNRHKKLCERLKYRRKHGWEPDQTSVDALLADTDSNSNMAGLACRTNKTLGFIVMDTRGSSMFAQRLGLNITSKTKKPVLVIFDNQTEQHFVMRQPVTKSNIVDFIENFTTHALTRDLRSSVVNSCDDSDTNVCVVDINSDHFVDVVMDLEKDVVVLYMDPSCGYCKAFSHVYLTVANYFKHTKDITFARLDASRNDLPWQYTVDAYPTVMIFPAHRKSESATFPDHLFKTLPNLVYFILQYGSAKVRLRTGLSICSYGCIVDNIAFAAQRIHTLNHAINVLVKSRRALHGRMEEHSADDVLKVLQWYDDVLAKRVLVKRLQMKETRHLYNALLSTDGPFIEMHKLTAIIKRYTAYTQRFSQTDDHRLFEPDENSDFFDFEITPKIEL